MKIFYIIAVMLICQVEATAGEKFLSLKNWDKLAASDIQKMVKDGADVNEKNAEGTTPLMIASMESSNPEVIEVLIKNGANVNDVAKGGFTALMMASGANSSSEVIEALIKNGANVNAVAKEFGNVTALILAASNTKNVKIVELLLENGAKKELKDMYGHTAIYYAKVNPAINSTGVIDKLK